MKRTVYRIRGLFWVLVNYACAYLMVFGDRAMFYLDTLRCNAYGKAMANAMLLSRTPRFPYKKLFNYLYSCFGASVVDVIHPRSK